MKTWLTAIALAFLFGCSTSGPKINPAQLTELRIGQTTATEIYQQFGRPSFLSRNTDGTQTAVYVRNEDGSAGGMLGSLSGATETVTMSFDSKGLLSSYKYSPPASARTTGETRSVTEAPAKPASTSSAAGAAPASAAATAPAAAAPQVAGAKAAPLEVPPPSGKKSNAPYLWDILRNSGPSDPRNR